MENGFSISGIMQIENYVYVKPIKILQPWLWGPLFLNFGFISLDGILVAISDSSKSEKRETCLWRNVFVKTSKGNWFLILLIMLLNMFVRTKNFREHWSQGSLSFQNTFSCTWHMSYKFLVCPLKMCLSWLKYVYTKSTCSTSNCRKRLIRLIPLQRDVFKLRLSSNSASNALSIDWW